MNDIKLLFHNDFGMAFHWKEVETIHTEKIQLVFRNTGLLFQLAQLKRFKGQIDQSIETCTLCAVCRANRDCRVLLLETPVAELSFAVSYYELHLISELVSGALFQIEMNTVLTQKQIHTTI